MRLLITSDFDQEYFDILSSSFESVSLDGWGKTGYMLTEDELIEKLDGIDVLIVGYEQISRRVISVQVFKYKHYRNGCI